MITASAADAVDDFALGQTSALNMPGWTDQSWTAITERFEELAALEPDWDGYGARPTDRGALVLAQRIAESLVGLPLPAPRIFPVPDGGVQMEWTAGPVELEFEVEPGAGSAIFVCDDHQAQQDIDGELPADDGLFQIAIRRLLAHA